MCLPVVKRGTVSGRRFFTVDTAAETLRLTTAGDWRRGTRINLERSLRLGDELGGHLVSGHVDGIAELVSRDDFLDSPPPTSPLPHLLPRSISPKATPPLSR